MKKSLFLVPVLALALAGCSNEEPAGNATTGDTDVNYLSVSMVSAMGSRAGATDFEAGTTDENAVKEIRFYFFDSEGQAAPVKYTTSGSNSYYDWVPQSAGSDMPNIEKKLSATVVINTQEGDKVPVSIVAIANPTQELKDLGDLSLAELNDVVANYANVAKDGFVMSNAVYAKGGMKMEAVDIAGHLATSPENALDNPVTIYIERVVAKVSLNMSASIESKKVGDETIYALSDNQGSPDGKKVYIRILGWNVTATADQSRLMKEINPKWAPNLFSNEEEWNKPEYFRSFWAVNPTNSITYSDFSEEPDAACQINVGGYTYVQENAAKNMEGEDADTHTKVIVAAQLVDEFGATLEFAEWGGARYAISDLRVLLANVSNIYKIDASGNRTKITDADIELTSATKSGVTQKAGAKDNVDRETSGRYYVYAQLKANSGEKPEGVSEVKYAIGREGAEIGADAVNLALIKLGGCKVWKEGKTYYFFDIEHLGEDGFGKYGVVRNHVYKTTIKSLTGLGTPVYDPDEVIYPEKPENDFTFIAAEINILSWRIVNQEVDMD